MRGTKQMTATVADIPPQPKDRHPDGGIAEFLAAWFAVTPPEGGILAAMFEAGRAFERQVGSPEPVLSAAIADATWQASGFPLP
jgi:hypothetical protein